MKRAMKATRVEWDGDDAVAMAAELRAQQPPLAEVSEEAIIAEVERDGDAALLRLEKKLGGVEPASIRVGASELAAARADTDPALLEALGAAAENIEAAAALEPGACTGLNNERGSVTIAEVPPPRRGPTCPAAAPPTLSTFLMCGVPARVAGLAASPSPRRPAPMAASIRWCSWPPN